MRTFLFLVATILLGNLVVIPANANSYGSAHFDGELSHVSTSNIKVINPKTHESLSFLLTPHFKQIFSRDGKTTVQLDSLRAGQFVKVYYDQKFLGQRHADRIYIVR
ncbi:MAG: hypothetical protein ABSE64_11895 [Vulcanimicrobiaceae bacterium]